MKKILSILFVFALLFGMSACSIVINTPSEAPTATKDTPPTTEATEVAASETTASETTAFETTTPTEAATTAPTTPSDGSYLLQIKNHDELIFDTPSYDGYCTDTVRQAGTYTIVEEKRDDEGNLWGKLKSGAGWVNITSVEASNADLLISAARLTYEPAEIHHEFGEKFGYATSVVFHAYQPLHYVQFFIFDLDGPDFVEGAPEDLVEQFIPGETMVIHMQFYGDMTRYGIRFTDDNGVVHSYFLAENGRNNALAFIEYTK